LVNADLLDGQTPSRDSPSLKMALPRIPTYRARIKRKSGIEQRRSRK